VGSDLGRHAERGLRLYAGLWRAVGPVRRWLEVTNTSDAFAVDKALCLPPDVGRRAGPCELCEAQLQGGSDLGLGHAD